MFQGFFRVFRRFRGARSGPGPPAPLGPQAAPRAPRRPLAVAAPQRRPRPRWRLRALRARPGPRAGPGLAWPGQTGTERGDRARGHPHRARACPAQGHSHQAQPWPAAQVRELPLGEALYRTELIGARLHLLLLLIKHPTSDCYTKLNIRMDGRSCSLGKSAVPNRKCEKHNSKATLCEKEPKFPFLRCRAKETLKKMQPQKL